MRLLEVFGSIYKHIGDQTLLLNDNPTAEAENHLPIVQAIERHDVASAQRSMREHFSGVRRRIKVAQAAGDSGRSQPGQV
jgi:DNA-binding FadR family transcriptional regulator